MTKCNFVTLCTSLILLLLGLNTQTARSEVTHFTVLHTNDLHSHFRSEQDALRRGGLARLKTAIDQVRKESPFSILVDGGDWSEGSIYYTEGVGRESIRLMDHLGYTAAVVGNHDWLNGPGALLNAYSEAGSNLALLAANISAKDPAIIRGFRERIPPYVIREVGGARVALIGVLTYEFIYDQYLKPIDIIEPFSVVRELSHELKRRHHVDFVVAVSHNQIQLNRLLLESSPDLDLVIGGHDHVKLTRPVVVDRRGRSPGWVVETGSWGRFLGRVDVQFDLSTRKAKLDQYNLIQIDFTIPEDPQTLTLIERLETSIEKKRGPIFHDHIADSETELTRSGLESSIGNFATDSYRNATLADIALDQINFIYGEIHSGTIRTVDVFNANPGVYNPITDKSWTLKVLPMRGQTLRWLLHLFLSSKLLSQRGGICLSGVQVEFNPVFNLGSFSKGIGSPLHPFFDLDELLSSKWGFGSAVLKKVLVQGVPLLDHRVYRVAASGGVIEAFKFLNLIFPGAIPLNDVKDTGMEDWRVMADYARSLSPIQEKEVPVGNRLTTTLPDLGILENDVSVLPIRPSSGGLEAKISVTVHNFGANDSSDQSSVRILFNSHGINEAIDPDWRDNPLSSAIPSIKPGASITLTWDQVSIPEDRGIHPIAIEISTPKGEEINQTNNRLTLYYRNHQ